MYDEVGKPSLKEEYESAPVPALPSHLDPSSQEQFGETEATLPSYLQPAFREQFQEVEWAIEALRREHAVRSEAKEAGRNVNVPSSRGNQVRRPRGGRPSQDVRGYRPVRTGVTFHLRGSESYGSGMSGLSGAGSGGFKRDSSMDGGYY
ncbi:hypothetical protein SODALDRAFT_327860 [Sodiomyces alkalinus F11]|uniref:Uncharacterized protein n=1 Tax=Sodiomyces alkalinus (strain CBS 110278 / VKM F-3762 / F11) TaxID=1314773 RepID=A0A3N2QAG7_SODAK|nr:hypothetical protein SODALDRAFT_327860 [Sodiomyces alkalinus F11]ROT43655.1 hypothetical protein SODALDRAFT_327860 [Sodiomyces alkalinus F11]